jgi:predicted  nucleic acid-binding Zn-ribbon protein
VATEGGDTKESATVAGAKLYTDDKVDAVNKSIKDINDKLVDLTTVMNFIGKSSTDPSTGTVTISGEVITPQLGDVVVFESFEYVYTGEADGWEIFGNVTADETRFSNLEDRAEALEGRMDTAEADIDDLQPRMTQAEADIDAIEAKIPVIEGDIDNLEGRMTQAETDIDAVEARALVLENAINDTEDAEGNTVKGIASRLTAVEGVAGDAATAKSLEDEVKRATERENEIAKAVTDNKAAQDEINEGFEANIDAITNELTGLLAWGTF